jgi:exosortase
MSVIDHPARPTLSSLWEVPRRRSAFGPFLLPAGLLILSVWSYGPNIADMVSTWSHDPQYTHGFLVPAFALFLLWYRREQLAVESWRHSWWGVLLLAGAAGLRLVGTYLSLGWLESVSLPLTVAGIFLTVGGWTAFRWAWPAAAFLGFMLPLPFRVQQALAPALQRLAALASTYILQTLGYCAVAEGTVIHMNEVKIQVIQACSGLSMLLTFFALSVGLVLVIDRPLRDKVVIVFSAVPVALVVNVLRIATTGVCLKTAGPGLANAVFHDLAGWLMMPLAMALLGLELYLLSRLFVEVETAPIRVRRASFFDAPARQPVSRAAC